MGTEGCELGIRGGSREWELGMGDGGWEIRCSYESHSYGLVIST